MEYSRVIVARIRELCYKRNISVNRLAEMSELRQSTLSNIMQENPRIPASKPCIRSRWPLA